MTSPQQDAQRLISRLAEHRRVVVAFSGGVDSSVVAAAAQRADLEMAIAVTAQSPSVAQWQLEIARRVAAEIGIEHRLVATGEADREDYRRNDGRRCYFCKQTLYDTLGRLAEEYPDTTIVSGTNADDLGDYRPGIEAGRQSGVVTPLADLGLGKSSVRQLAALFGLSNKDLPASPCLASRIAYGTPVTPERLRRVEQAEAWLHQQGFAEVRVRLHDGELARVEVPTDQIPSLVRLNRDQSVTRALQEHGFKFVTVDLGGLRSGSMNRVLVSLGTNRSSSEASSEMDRSTSRSEVVR